jgi:cytidine deaminase
MEIIMDEKKINELISAAVSARENAYSPYSNFCVGAALLSSDGEIFVGANVENVSYGGTICAERSAFVTAVSSGVRDFSAIAIVGAPRGAKIEKKCPPCGICRQFMSELCRADFKVILFDGKTSYVKTLGELLPEEFDGDNLT